MPTPPITYLRAIAAAGSADGAVVVPLRSDLPFFEVQATLDEVVYTLRLRWNARAAAWFLAVLDDQGVTTYADGIRLVVNFPLLAYRTGRQPPGALVAMDTSGAGEDPGLADIGPGRRVQLVYFDAATIGA